MEKLFFVLLTFLISFVIGWIAIPRIVIISKIKRLFDKPDARKVHHDAIPRLGGISFFPSMMIAVSMMLGFRYYLNYVLPPQTEVFFVSEFMFLLSGMFVLFFIGMADDLIGVGYRYKFLAQIFAASMFAFAGLAVTSMGGVFMVYQMPYWLATVLTILFVIYIINAFNLIDGVDGLCSGLSSIILMCFGVWFIYRDMYVYGMLALGMLGVVIAFFKYNVTGNRLKIFMGDTGSLTLGILIAFLALKFIDLSQDVSPVFYQIKAPIAMIIGLLFIPLFDTSRVFISRVKRGKSPFHPDKTHIHHKMLNLGFSHLQSTAILMGTQVLFIGMNILLSEVLSLNINIVLAIDIFVAVGINHLINRRIEAKSEKLKS